MRASMYLFRLDWHLEGVVSASDRKRILRSLRDEIDQDPRPLHAVLADLGSPRTLALRYGEDGRPRPLWSVGALTAAAALVIYWIAFGAFTGGMLSVVDGAAPMSASSSFFFVTVTAFSDARGLGFGWSGGWEWIVVPLVICTVALLLGARCWRLVRRGEVTTP
jgi:hypothetical protein